MSVCLCVCLCVCVWSHFFFDSILKSKIIHRICICIRDYRTTAKHTDLSTRRYCITAGSNREKVKIASASHIMRLRLLLLELALLLLFGAYLSTAFLSEFVRRFILPQIDLIGYHRFKASEDYYYPAHEYSYYPRKCDPTVVKASTLDELKADHLLEGKDAAELFKRHGVITFDGLLSPETASQLRDYILANNKRATDFSVLLEDYQRWSFKIGIDADPIVAKASREILSNQRLVNALEAVIGPNPSVMEFTAITVKRGADAQGLHADSWAGSNMFTRSFFPTYSLFIALQNTTQDMGATRICPGTFACMARPPKFCKEKGLSLAQDGVWKTGTGAFLTQQTMHEGGKHTSDTPRVMFYFSFTPRPRWGRNQLETRTFPYGGTAAQHWSQWGFTLKDYQDPERYMKWPWRILRSFGLYKPRDRQWGWDFPSLVAHCLAMDECDELNVLDLDDDHRPTTIPWFLYSKIPDNIAEESEEHTVTAQIIYMGALNRIKWFFLGLYLAGIVASCTVGPMIRRKGRGETRSSAVPFALMRHVVLCTLMFVLARSAFLRTSRSGWARNIEQGRQYLSYGNIETMDRDRDKRGKKKPHTLDVLVLDHLHSDYLASLSSTHDILHPGNKAFDEVVGHYAGHYDHMSPLLQRVLCDKVLSWVSERINEIGRGRRILTKNEENLWVILPSSDRLRFVHKQLVRAANPFTRELIFYLDSLLSECKFGHFRETVLHRKTIPSFLYKLQDSVMQFSNRVVDESAESLSVSSLSFQTRSLARQRPPRKTSYRGM
jgi:hypothetical protein